IEEGMKAGWLIATEGVDFGATGVRVHKSTAGKARSPTAPSPRRRRSSAAMRCSKPLTRMRWLSSRDISSGSAAQEPARFTSFTRCRRENRLHDCTGLAAGFGPRHPLPGIARSCPRAIDFVAAERARVATEGWGARLLALHPTSSSVPRFGLVLYYAS